MMGTFHGHRRKYSLVAFFVVIYRKRVGVNK
jgi:hypothetical protein